MVQNVAKRCITPAGGVKNGGPDSACNATLHGTLHSVRGIQVVGCSHDFDNIAITQKTTPIVPNIPMISPKIARPMPCFSGCLFMSTMAMIEMINANGAPGRIHEGEQAQIARRDGPAQVARPTGTAACACRRPGRCPADDNRARCRNNSSAQPAPAAEACRRGTIPARSRPVPNAACLHARPCRRAQAGRLRPVGEARPPSPAPAVFHFA